MTTQTQTPVDRPATATVQYKLEVAVVPVSDVDRAKAFYAGLGWREDADFPIRDDFRVLQFTPPGSSASIIFGLGVTDAAPGAGAPLLLAVSDIEAARADLVARGVQVSEVFHSSGFDLNGERAYGRDPEGGSYKSFAEFSDPDGNAYLLQELTSRLPGRLAMDDIDALAALLHETAERHDPYEKSSPPHDWWDWYAAYMTARRNGDSPDVAAERAGEHMAAGYLRSADGKD